MKEHFKSKSMQHRLQLQHYFDELFSSKVQIYFSQSIQDVNMRYTDEKKEARLDEKQDIQVISIYNKLEQVPRGPRIPTAGAIS